MKTTIVPAQITTVEDKVAGNLSFTQLILLIVPVFIGGAIYAFIPPLISFSIAKTIVVAAVTLLCLTLAIRVKGKLVLEWITVKARYNSRPRFYTYNKNESFLRLKPKVIERQEKPKTVIESAIEDETPDLHVSELVYLENIVADPKAEFHIQTTKKGGLSVNIKQVK